MLQKHWDKPVIDKDLLHLDISTYEKPHLNKDRRYNPARKIVTYDDFATNFEKIAHEFRNHSIFSGF